MQVGAIGSGISAMSYSPYIYNTNRLSSASLDKIQPIENDTSSSKTDFSDLVSGETTNPLGKGETSDFADVVAMQFSLSQSMASRVMQPEGSTDTTQQSNADTSDNLYKMSQAADAYSQSITA